MKSAKAGKGEGGACYKSRFFVLRPQFSQLIRQRQLSIRDQSKVGCFSAWSVLLCLPEIV